MKIKAVTRYPPTGGGTGGGVGNFHHYDRIANLQYGRYLSQAEHDLICRAEQMTSEPGLALDVGAAGGRWSMLLHRRGWNNVITDVNPVSIERCRDILPDAECHLVDPLDHHLPADDASLDMILCIAVFMVIGAPWFTQEAMRTLKPGGLLVGEFNNKWSWRGILHHTVTKVRGGLDYYERGYPEWRSQLRAAGFEIEFERGMAWLPFGRYSDSPLVKPAASTERALGLNHLVTISPTVIFIARKVGEPSPGPKPHPAASNADRIARPH